MNDDDVLVRFAPDSSTVHYLNGSWNSFSTSDRDATVSFQFQGTSIDVFGSVQSHSSSAVLYVLDGEPDHTFLYDQSSSKLYSSPRLAAGSHTLAIRLANENATLAVAGGSVSSPASAALDHRRRIIAIVAGSVGGFILIAVLLVSLLLYQRRKRHYPARAYALGPLQATLPLSKEAFTRPMYHHHGLSFTHSSDTLSVVCTAPHIKAPPPPLPDPLETPTKVPRRTKSARDTKSTGPIAV